MAWDDEDLPVILLEDGKPVPTTTRTVEVGPPRGRRREAALAAAAVLVVVAVGVFGDGGDDTTSPTPAKRTTTTGRTTSSRPPRSTTTTSWPQHVAGTGPLLPGGTGTAVVVTLGSRVEVIDLDTGNRCTTDPPGTEGWPLTMAAPEATFAVIDTGGSFVTVDSRCAVGPVVRRDSAWPVAITPESIWYLDEQRGVVVERGIASGDTRFRLEVTPFQPVHAVVTGRRLLVAIHGDVSLVDPVDGSVRTIGTGQPLAASGDTVALAHCPALRCGLVTVNLRTGARRELAGVAPMPWEATFSPDGRLLAVRVAGPEGGPPVPAVVDLDTGSVTTYEEFASVSFSRRGGWILASQEDDIVAFKQDGETVRLDGMSTGDAVITIATG